MYLLRYLHEEYGDIHAYFSTKEDVPHMWGLQYCMQPWRMGEDFFWECKKVCSDIPVWRGVTVPHLLCWHYCMQPRRMGPASSGSKKVGFGAVIGIEVVVPHLWAMHP